MNMIPITHKQAGTSLVEILVTMVIVAIGLLGYAGLQVNSLQSNRTATYRSIATILAYDVVECMRANRISANSYVTTLAQPSTTYTGTSIDQVDLNHWKTSLEQSLPSGQGSVTIDLVTGVVSIVVSWEGQWVEAGSNQFETRTTL